MKNLSILIAFILLGATSIDAQKSKYSFKEVYDTNTPAKLMSLSNDGDISVQAHDKNTIEIEYVVTRNNKLVKGSKEEVLNEIGKQIEILVKEAKNSLSVHIKDRPTKGYRDYKDSYSIDLRFYVPRETSCDITSSDGDLAISGLIPNQKCQTSDGDIAISDIKGNLNLLTSDGDIALQNIGGDVKAITSDGDIAAHNVAGKLDAHTSDGDVVRR